MGLAANGMDATGDTIGVLPDASALSRAAYVAPAINPKAAATDIAGVHLPEENHV